MVKFGVGVLLLHVVDLVLGMDWNHLMNSSHSRETKQTGGWRSWYSQPTGRTDNTKWTGNTLHTG